jgi:hypothetical protein
VQHGGCGSIVGVWDIRRLVYYVQKINTMDFQKLLCSIEIISCALHDQALGIESLASSKVKQHRSSQ